MYKIEAVIKTNCGGLHVIKLERKKPPYGMELEKFQSHVYMVLM